MDPTAASAGRAEKYAGRYSLSDVAVTVHHRSGGDSGSSSAVAATESPLNSASHYNPYAALPNHEASYRDLSHSSSNNNKAVESDRQPRATPMTATVPLASASSLASSLSNMTAGFTLGRRRSVDTKVSGIVAVSVVMPDGVVHNTTVNIADTLTMAPMFTAVMDKAGLSAAADQHELVLIHRGSEKVVPLEESPVTSLSLIKADASYRLGIRQKKAPSAAVPRRIGFVNIGRSSPKPTASGLSISSTSTGILPDSTAPMSSLSVASSSDKSFADSTTSAKGNGFFRSVSSGNIMRAIMKSVTPDKPAEESSQTIDTNIMQMESIQRRNLQMILPDELAKVFSVVPHDLHFNKLAERSRFLSWSRGSNVKLTDSGSTKVFGVPYTSVMEAEYMRDQDAKIPKFCRVCFDYIAEHGINSTGIFRVSGVARKIKALKDEVDSGKDLVITREYKVHDVTGLLKLFFREMPEPLLTHKLFEFYCGAANCLDGQRLLLAIKYLTFFLPSMNLHLLEAFLRVLAKVASNARDPKSTRTGASSADLFVLPAPAAAVSDVQTGDNKVAPSENGMETGSTAAIAGDPIVVGSPNRQSSVSSFLASEEDPPPCEVASGSILQTEVSKNNDSTATPTKEPLPTINTTTQPTPALATVTVAEVEEPVPDSPTISQPHRFNHMDAVNLAIVVAPNLLRGKDTKAASALEDNELVTKVIEVMIRNVDTLFAVPPDIIAEFKKRYSGG